eukprot:14629985-Alexandrium_andersonii.AAC.1
MAWSSTLCSSLSCLRPCAVRLCSHSPLVVPGRLPLPSQLPMSFSLSRSLSRRLLASPLYVPPTSRRGARGGGTELA